MTNLLNNSNSMEETNEILKLNNLPSYEDSFAVSFRISKKKFLTVAFGNTKAYNQQPYFASSASTFNRNRTDFESCGQVQESLLSKDSVSYKFFEKWDLKHTANLNLNELEELKIDLEILKEKYPHIESDNFDDMVAFDRKLSK